MSIEGHRLTMGSPAQGVTRDLRACPPLPHVADLCGCARSDGAHGSGPAVCPVGGQSRDLSIPGPIYTSGRLGASLAMAERLLADRVAYADLIAEAIVRRQVEAREVSRGR